MKICYIGNMGREVVPRLHAEDKAVMEQIPAAGNINHKFALRLQTVLHRADGNGTTDIAALWGIHPMTVSLYGKRYNERGLDALVRDTTRKPGKAPFQTRGKPAMPDNRS
jgi:hypothetical protein